MVGQTFILKNQYVVETKGVAATNAAIRSTENRIKAYHNLQKKGIVLNKAQLTDQAKLKASYIGMGGSVQRLTGTHKGLLLSMTKLRWTLVNVAMAAAIAYTAFRVLVKPTIDLETEMVTVRKRTGMTREAIKGLAEDFIFLSKSMPLSATELAKIGGIAGQLGIRGSENILEFSRVVAMMGSATVLSTEEAGLALAKLSKAFDFPINQVENMGSVINELSNITAANSKEIVSAMTRMAASAHQMGITEDMAAALSATLINMGMRAERAGTRMRTAFTRMATQTEQLARLFRVFGGEVETTSQIIKQRLDEDANKVLLDTVFTLSQIESGTERVAQATEIFGRVGATAVNGLVSNYLDLQENIIVASDEYKNAISLQAEYNIALESTANQWTILIGKIVAGLTRADTVLGGMIQKINLIVEEEDLFREIREKGIELGAEAKPGVAYQREWYTKMLERMGPIPGGAGGLPEEWVYTALEEEARARFEVIKATEGEAEAKAYLLEIIRDLDEQKKKVLSPEEEMNMIEKLTDATVHFSEEARKGYTAGTIALQKKEKVMGEVNELTEEQANYIKLQAEARAKYLLGLVDEDETITDLLEREKEYNEDLKILQEQYALSSMSVKEYKEELAKLKKEYSDVMRLFEIRKLKEEKEETESLSDATSGYRLEIKRLQRELRGFGDSLSAVRDKMRETEKEIQTILSRRFKIRGISETEVSHLIRQQELELQKARFATLGLGTAEEFLRGASLMTADALNTQTNAVRRLTDATRTSQDRYDVWQTTLRETIRSLLINSQDIDRDVTGVVKRAQTELLGITQFDRRGGDQFTAMEENINALGMAQDIFFGEEQEKLSYSEQLREDRINGMNESAEQAIANLEKERETLVKLGGEEEDWIERQTRFRAEIEENKKAIEKITEEWNDAAEARGKYDRSGMGGRTLGGGGDAGRPRDWKGHAVSEQEYENLKSGATKAIRRQSGEEILADFISRPGMPAQRFSPDDTIIGTKKGVSNQISIVIQGYNRDPKPLAIEIKRQLNSLA